MKTLHLTLEKKWFDMILSGEKKEEYRELKPFWITRLVNKPFSQMSSTEAQLKNDLDCCPNGFWKDFDTIKFTNGYSKNAPYFIVKFEGIYIGKCKADWSYGAIEDHFVIKLGKVI